MAEKKNPKRVRAGKKAAATRARNARSTTRRRSTSSPPRKRRTTRRRRRGMSEGLAEVLNFSQPNNPTSAALQGGIAGLGVGLAMEKLIDDPAKKLSYGLVGTALAVMAKKPAFAAALGAITALWWYQDRTVDAPGSMSENAQFLDPAALSADEPLILDAEGNPLLSAGEYANSQRMYPAYFPYIY